MPDVRIAQPQDRDEFRNLWRICFGDSEAFMDWFFSERYFPEFSVCLLEDGTIMSALQSYPLHVRIRDHILPASMLAGVSTHPEREGRGYMKQIFLRYMQRVRELSIPIVIHTPAHIPTFHTRGHLPVSETLHLNLEHAQAKTMPGEISPHSLYTDLAPLQVCYLQSTAKYSGCISRTMADFAFKLRDYASDGAKCLVRMCGDVALGYCVYYITPERLHAEECFAKDGETLALLLQALCHEAKGRKLHVKLPPDAKADLPGADLSTRQQGVMGIADVSQTLRILVGDASFVFEIIDNTVPGNTGIWDGAGKPSDRKPQIRLESGRLGQFLCGYRSLRALDQDQQATILDKNAARELDTAFPEKICFITDEY